MTRKTCRITVISGDDIGHEVMPKGLCVLEATARRFGISLKTQYVDWASCDYYQQHGQMMPDDWKQQPQGMDTILFGAVGWSITVSDHVPLWSLLLRFRRESGQYIDLYPVRLFEGVPCPLANHKPGDINYYVMYEDIKGEYMSFGGIIYEDIDRRIMIQESVYSCKGAERLLKFASDLAQSRRRKHVTLIAKSNGIAIGTSRWDKRAGKAARSYPDVTFNEQHIDTLAVCSVPQPGRFDVVTATNLLGDILSNLGPTTIGMIGLVLLANLDPDCTFPLLFRPVYGPVSNIYGKSAANPIAMIWPGALVLDFLMQGQGAGRTAHDAIVMAIETVLKEGPRTPDPGGTTSIIQVGGAVAAHLG